MSRRPALAVVVLTALLAAAALHAAGSGSLAAPPAGPWSELEAWYARTGPGPATIVVVRLVALAGALWLAVVGGLQALADGIRSERLSRLADAASPAFLHSLSRGAAGISVTAVLVLPALPAGAGEDPPGTAVMIPLDAPAPSTASTTSTTASTTSTTASTTSSTIPPPPASTTTTTPAVITAPPAPVVPARPGDEVVVARGDSFWSIAVEEAGTRELVPYWLALIEANRDRLVDPSNPDLLYPGQVLRLP